MAKPQLESPIKLISQCFIKPKYEVDALKKGAYLYLGPIDLAMLSVDYMQKGLLFTKPFEFNVQVFLEKLKHSLSLTLLNYYPLAGQLDTQKFHDEHACSIFLDCNKGPGARLIHASVRLHVSDILCPTDIPMITRSFFDLGERATNHDGHSIPLLSIQVTELVDGIFIGFTMNHSVADGTSLWNFISTLSKVFQSNDVKGNTISNSCKPIYKTFFPDGYGPILKLPYLNPSEFIVRYESCPLRERIFHFSPSSMAKLKAKANEECGTQTISSFQALSGLVWRSITRARNLPPNEETTCLLIANIRARLDPPLTQAYFGNFVTRARGSAKVGELVNHGLGLAAMLVHQGVKAQDDEAIREFLKIYAEAPYVFQPHTVSDFYEPNSVFMAGSARFDMYGPEFGLGRALAVRDGYNNKDDGKLTANPGIEGGGSVDLEICLKPETMGALESDVEFMSFVSSV